MCAALVATAAAPAIASADILVNDIDTTIDNTTEAVAIAAGTSTTIGFYVRANNDSGAPGCNLGVAGDGLHIDVSGQSMPAGITFSPFRIDECDDPSTGTIEGFVSSTFAVAAAVPTGGYTINPSQFHIVKSAGTPGIVDAFNADFNLRVNLPPDSTPPAISSVPSGDLGLLGWYVGPVTITWTVTDGGSGVFIDAGCGIQVFTEDTAAGSSFCQAHSVGGSASSTKTFKRDATPPTDLGAVGVVDGAVVPVGSLPPTPSCAASDATSGVASCTVTGWGTTLGAHTLTVRATDRAGNVSTAAITYTVGDPTGPVITSAVTGVDGANGWYVGPVTVAWSVTDAETPVVIDAGCGTQTFTSETASASSSCEAHSLGGTASASESFRIDLTDPAATVTLAGLLGDNGWYVGAVTATTTGSDALGPVSCTAPQVFEADGASQSAVGRCTDDAGRIGTASPMSFGIDATAPTDVAFVGVADGASFTVGSVPAEPTCTATDATSGLDSCTVTGWDIGIGSHTLVATATDRAGNSVTTSLAYSVVDPSAPVISSTVSGPSGANGWYVGDVTVAWTVTDPESAVVIDTGCGTQAFTTDTASGSSSCTAHSLGGTASTTESFRIDATAPTDLGFAGITPGASFPVGSVPEAPTCTATDATSGLDRCVVSGWDTTVGLHTLVATAVDRAGNVATATLDYEVVAPVSATISGFYAPVRMDSDTERVVNTVQGGSTVPVKFEVFHGSVEMTSTAVVEELIVVETACSIGVPLAGGSVSVDLAKLTYDASGGQFIFTWKTPKTSKRCYDVKVTVQGGATKVAHFATK